MKVGDKVRIVSAPLGQDVGLEGKEAKIIQYDADKVHFQYRIQLNSGYEMWCTGSDIQLAITPAIPLSPLDQLRQFRVQVRLALPLLGNEATYAAHALIEQLDEQIKQLENDL